MNARRARVPLALAALLLCPGLAAAQEVQTGESVTPRRLTVNVKSFEDIALEGKRLVESGKLGPDTVLDVSATAERAEDGRLKPESVKIEWRTGADELLSELARQVITALSESRVLGGLESVKAVRLGLKLDRQNVSVLVACETPSEADAERYAISYGLLARVGAINKRGTDEGSLYERLGFSSEGKVFKMTFGMSRAEAARMIADMLAKRTAKGQPD
ncbi:MAG: hypothetical protein LC795_16060 [Acidobacteria bacterium]|nr:hypothetical protein [Acidobacteriota bacterium]